MIGCVIRFAMFSGLGSGAEGIMMKLLGKQISYDTPELADSVCLSEDKPHPDHWRPKSSQCRLALRAGVQLHLKADIPVESVARQCHMAPRMRQNYIPYVRSPPVF